MVSMRLLMLGGTRFVGRVVVDDALARGWEVTVLHRGRTGVAPSGADVLHVDRTDPGALADAVDDRRWDVVVDTWAGSPLVATEGASVLKGHVERYAYVSSVSVYRWGQHVDERSPLVDAESTSDSDGDYSAAKRGAELGVLASFPDALLARAGLILGPHEDIGRLPWWLQRIAAGGRVVAPGVPDRPLQYVDARDAASVALSGLASGLSGAYDVISPSGHATTAELLHACVDATASEAELCGSTRIVWLPLERNPGHTFRAGFRRRANGPAFSKATRPRPPAQGSTADRSAVPSGTLGSGCGVSRSCRLSVQTVLSTGFRRRSNGRCWTIDR